MQNIQLVQSRTKNILSNSIKQSLPNATLVRHQHKKRSQQEKNKKVSEKQQLITQLAQRKSIHLQISFLMVVAEEGQQRDKRCLHSGKSWLILRNS